MSWIAVVPLRQGGEPKTRLAARLSVGQRIALSVEMARRVVAALGACPAVARILILSSEPPPSGLSGEWVGDRGRGLNAELDALRRDLDTPAMLVIHGDLPLIGPEDVAALIVGAEEKGYAFAPDRHGAGTNAVAIGAGHDFAFAFGEGSLARHCDRAPDAALIRRPGLSLDVDTPGDLNAAIVAGFRWPAE